MRFSRHGLTAALCFGVLTACGNNPQAGDGLATAKGLAAGLLSLGHPRQEPAADGAAVRASLQQIGQPIYAARLDKLHYVGYMVPFGNNGPVQTWSSSNHETVSLKEGVLVATRGFGADIMSATAPTIGQIRSGTGSFHRVYYYLDGADQPVSAAFDCTFTSAGAETVTILGSAYATHRVTEACANPETRFQNAYWFDGSGSLRQSLQYMSTQAASVQLQRVID